MDIKDDRRVASRLALMRARAELTDEEIEQFLLEEREDHEQRRGSAFDMATRSVSAAITTRLKQYAWAKSMIEPVRRARLELVPEGKRGKTDAAMARWLNDNKFRTVNGHTFNTKAAGLLMYAAAEGMIEHAVLECRTRMTAVALSADFASADARVESLEAEYLPIIADALETGYLLAGLTVPRSGALMQEAQAAAVRVAAEQRSQPMSMLARARLAIIPEDYIRDVFAPIPAIASQ